jgi:uncharacterized membrane protein
VTLGLLIRYSDRASAAARRRRLDARLGGGLVLLYRIRRLGRSLVTSFWFWPLISIAFALWLSMSLGGAARSVPLEDAVSGGLAKAANLYAGTILTTTAAADITILTFVFSTLMVVLQLASSQLSPRIVRTIVRDGSAQVSMAIMVGGFVFSLSALLNVFQNQDQNPLVASAMVVVALFWTTLIVLTFLRFVSYTIARMRAPAVIRSISETVARDLRHMYAQPPSERGRVPSYDVVTTITAPRDGLVTGLRLRELAIWAEKNEALVTLNAGLGDHVTAGVPIGTVRSAAQPVTLAISAFMAIEAERTVRGDPPYGFRLLVDIANRALSPAINDPTTACQVLDELENLLVLLAQRPEEPGLIHDTNGVLRLDAPVKNWRSYLLLAIQEIYEFGAESSQVTQRIDRLLAELAEVVTGARLDAVQQMRDRIVVVAPMISTKMDAGGGIEAQEASA